MFEGNLNKDIGDPDFDYDQLKSRKYWCEENKAKYKEECKRKRDEMNSKLTDTQLKLKRDKVNTYYKNRRDTEPLFKLTTNTRNLIKNGITKQGYSKKSRTYEILGISYEDFKIYLESKFIDGMTWDNFGVWELDHIIPVASANTEEELIKLNHYKNFQPLWQSDNRSKGTKIIHI